MRRLHSTALATLFAMAAAPAIADKVQFSADLSAKCEVPATNSGGTGLATATLDTSSRSPSWEVTFWGLSGPATAAHFHGPAEAGKNAGVAFGILKTGDAQPAKGSATLTPEQMADLMAGKWYVNVHTAANGGGEIRGQVMKKQ